jgi:hypothetical protein
MLPFHVFRQLGGWYESHARILFAKFVADLKQTCESQNGLPTFKIGNQSSDRAEFEYLSVHFEMRLSAVLDGTRPLAILNFYRLGTEPNSGPTHFHRFRVSVRHDGTGHVEEEGSPTYEIPGQAEELVVIVLNKALGLATA